MNFNFNVKEHFEDVTNSALLGVTESMILNNPELFEKCKWNVGWKKEELHKLTSEDIYNTLHKMLTAKFKKPNLPEINNISEMFNNEDYTNLLKRLRERKTEYTRRLTIYNTKTQLREMFFDVLEHCMSTITKINLGEICSIKTANGYIVINKDSATYYENTNVSYWGKGNSTTCTITKPSHQYVEGVNQDIDWLFYNFKHKYLQNTGIVL